MVSPARAGMASTKRIMAAPTKRIVMVWPIPHRTPTSADFPIERSRLTMVETAMTWSGSVACRMPRRKPIARMANPAVMFFYQEVFRLTFAGYLRTDAGARPTRLARRDARHDKAKWNGRSTWLCAVAENTHQLCGGVGESRATTRDQIDVTREIQLADLYLFHPTVGDFPVDAHARHDGDAHTHLDEALDALNGGHFNGHVENRTVSSKELDDAATEGRL